MATTELIDELIVVRLMSLTSCGAASNIVRSSRTSNNAGRVRVGLGRVRQRALALRFNSQSVRRIVRLPNIASPASGLSMRVNLLS